MRIRFSLTMLMLLAGTTGWGESVMMIIETLYPVIAESEYIQGVEVPRYGFINREGTLVIPAKYAHASRFSNGFAVVDFDFNKVVSVKYKGGKKPRPELSLINAAGEIV